MINKGLKNVISHWKMLLCLAFAFMASLCTPYVLKDKLVNFSLNNSIFSIFVFVGYYILFQYSIKYLKKLMAFFVFFLGFIFSTFMVFGKNIYTTGSANILQLKTWLLILVFLPVFSALVVLCFHYLPMLCRENQLEETGTANKKRFFIVWLLIFLAWIPILLASYPGVYGYDSIYQINYYLSGEFSLHHPIIHSYILGFFIITVGNLLGGYEIGMCCYSVFQMLCLSATLSILYTYYISKKCNRVFGVGVLLVFMFLPTNPIMAMSATKDILFSAFIALAVMFLLMISENPERLKSVKFDIALTAVFILVSIFRNQGKYIVIVTFVLSLFLLWKYKKQLLAMLVAFVVLLGIYNGPVTDALNGVPANPIREMMSIPCLQLSRVATLCQDQLTDEESQLIKEYVGRCDEYNKGSAIADIFKGSLDVERLKKNPMEFIGLWLKVGLKCPTAYFDAFARVTIGYWYPDMNYPDPNAYHPYWEYAPTGFFNSFDATKYVLLKQTPVKGFETLHNFLLRFSYSSAYQRLSVVSMLFGSALPIWCALIVFAYSLYKKQYRHMIPLVFVLMFVITLLLGPVVLYRYVYPLHLVTPLLACIGGCKYKNEKVEN